MGEGRGSEDGEREGGRGGGAFVSFLFLTAELNSNLSKRWSVGGLEFVW